MFKGLKKPKPFKKLSNAQLVSAVIVVALIAGFGIHTLVGSRALSPYVSVDAAKGTLTSPATTVSGGGSSSGSYVQFGTNSTTSSGTTRSPYTWPFSWDSIWNLPIASTANYIPANLASGQVIGEQEVGAGDYDSTNPNFPLKPCSNCQTSTSQEVDGGTGSVNVHVDPSMSAPGQWNDCAALLGSDNRTVYQGQTLLLSQGGNPSFGGTDDSTWAPVDIEGDGTYGCHGGSNLSGLGGTLYQSDITQSGPITHALKLNIDCSTWCTDGDVWPATWNNGNVDDGGNNQYIKMGTLMALPRSINPASFSDPAVRKLAYALQDYGGYIVDDSAWQYHDNIVTNYNYDLTTSFGSDGMNEIDSILNELDVVTNNTSSTPGGGSIGSPRCAPYAPEFSDGNDAPPSVTVTDC